MGLATTGSLAGLDWPSAIERIALLGASAAIAADASPEQLRRALDPRATMRFGVPRPRHPAPGRGPGSEAEDAR